MSGEQFQQWSQSSPLLSLDRFHLKQTPVLNFNCGDSLGFPSYGLHKKTFFFLGFNPGPVVRKRVFCFLVSMTKKGLRHCSFRCPSGLLCIFKCSLHFSFRSQSGLLSMTKKRFASLFFSLHKWLALHFQNVCIIFLFIAQMGFFGTSGGQLGFWLEGLGAQLGILWDPSRLGSFGGPFFFGILGTP